MTSLRERWRDVIDPVQSRTHERPLRNGIVLLGLIALAVYMAVAHDIPIINGKPGYPVRAEFASVNQVSDQTPVRVHGVDVGMVDRIGPGSDPLRSSQVTFRVTKPGLVVHRDARAQIRWRTVLGGRMYIDLDPGSPRSPKLGDGVIGLSQTGNQTELDDVLQVYDGGTAQAQRDVFKGLGQGVADPAATRSAIGALPALRTVGRGVEPYTGTESGDLRRLVAATATTVQALGADPAGLQELVTGARQTLEATATRRAALGRFLEESPPSLDETLRTTTRVQTTLDHLDPLVRALRPGARRLAAAADAATPALTQLRALLVQLRPLLTDLRPTFGDLRTVGDTGTAVAEGLKPVVDRVNDVVLPFLAKTDHDTQVRNDTAIGATFSVLDMAAAEFDAIGHRLHLSTPAANNSVISLYFKQMQASCAKAATGAVQRAACPALARALTDATMGRGTHR